MSSSSRSGIERLRSSKSSPESVANNRTAPPGLSPFPSSKLRIDPSATWAGNIHPARALRQYRDEFVGNAKAVAVGMTSNGFTVADPNDCGMLDVVGFDTSVPAAISDFVRAA